MNASLILLDRIKAMRQELAERPLESQADRSHWADRLELLAGDVAAHVGRVEEPWMAQQCRILADMEKELRCHRFRKEAAVTDRSWDVVSTDQWEQQQRPRWWELGGGHHGKQ